MKRKKRLEKGIESLKKQIKIHEEKRDKAKEEGNLERYGYYESELEVFEKTKEKKKKQLEKE